MFRILLALTITFYSMIASSQPINNQWHGHWTSQDGHLLVTSKNIIEGGKVCRWVAKAPSAGHEGCISFYDGSISKKDLLSSLESMREGIQSSPMNTGPDYLAKENENLQKIKSVINQLGEGNYRVVRTSDADHPGSGDCNQSYALDNEKVFIITRCQSVVEAMLSVGLMQKGTVSGPITTLNGEWTSTKWKYGYKLQDGLGTATATNSPRFKVGDEIIFLRATGKNLFEGEQVYQDGKFHPVKATLLPDGRLQFKGEKNISWTMDRK